MDENASAFLSLTEKWAELLLNEAILAVPFEDPKLLYFSKMNSDQQAILLKSLEIQVQLLEDLARNGLSLLKNTKTFLFSFLAKMELSTTPDLNNLVEDIDYIALYNLHQQMIFLSPNHLTWMSYTMEDVLCRPWFELFRRPPEIEKILFERIKGFAIGQTRHTIMNTDIPAHQVIEIQSPEKRVVTSSSKLYSPLFKGNIPAGLISINQSRIDQISRKKS